MNERIKQLVLQSQLVYETTDGKVYNSWEDYVDLTEYVEKFSYLIVRECRDIVGKTRDQAIEDKWNVDEAMSTAMFNIEDHFGV